jgi:hypothetical protein
VSGGDHRWFKRRTRKERPVTGDIHIIIIITIIIIVINSVNIYVLPEHGAFGQKHVLKWLPYITNKNL